MICDICRNELYTSTFKTKTIEVETQVFHCHDCNKDVEKEISDLKSFESFLKSKGIECGIGDGTRGKTIFVGYVHFDKEGKLIK